MFGKRQPTHQGVLAAPDEVVNDKQAHEVLSVWILSTENNIATIKPQTWPDPFMWGMLLADVARHIANALAKSGKGNAPEILARVRQGLDAELNRPTDTPTGNWRT